MKQVGWLIVGFVLSLPAAAQDAVGTRVDAPGKVPAEVSAAVPGEVPGAIPVPVAAEPASASVSEPAAAVAALGPAVNTSASAARPVVIDRLDLGTTSITGNQELPKVLYIVPWKRSDLGDLIGRPVNTLLDEVLAPVDREVFERHLSYYETLHGQIQEE